MNQLLRYIFITGIAFSITGTALAQQGTVITLTQEISAKFDTIQMNMHDLVKAFGKNPDNSSSYRTRYSTDFKIGRNFIFISETNESQKMEIRFSSIYNKGTNEDYLKFYSQVVKKISTMLATTHTVQPEEIKDKNYETIFYENGKNVTNSSTSVYIICNFFFPDVAIYFYKKK